MGLVGLAVHLFSVEGVLDVSTQLKIQAPGTSITVALRSRIFRTLTAVHIRARTQVSGM